MPKCPVKLAFAVAFIAGMTLLIEHRKEIAAGIEKLAVDCSKNHNNNCDSDNNDNEDNDDDAATDSAETAPAAE